MIDWKKIKGENDDVVAAIKIVAGSSVVSDYLEAAIAARIDVAKDSFKSKMNNLDEKLKTANESLESFKGIDADEINTLKAAAKGKGELEATLSGIKDKYKAAEEALAKKTQELQSKSLETIINNSISNFNTKNPDVSIRDDARDFVFMLAREQFKEQDGQFVPQKNGTPMVTDSGYANAEDWINGLRSDKPLFFNAPTGSGASGSKSGSATPKIISRSEFDAITDIQKRMDIGKTHTITD